MSLNILALSCFISKISLFYKKLLKKDILPTCSNDARTRIKLKTLPGGIRHIVSSIKQDTVRGVKRENRFQKSDPSHGSGDLSVGGWKDVSRAWFRVDRGESHCTAPVGATSRLRAFVATSGTPVADSAESCTLGEPAMRDDGAEKWTKSL